MTDRTTLTQVTNDDQLFQGYYNEIGVFYKEATDDGITGVYSEAVDATTQLVSTFTFSSVPTNYHVVACEIEDISVDGTEGGGSLNTQSLFGIILSDGTTHYSPRVPDPIEDNSGYSQLGDWQSVSVGSPNWFLYQKSINSTPVTIGKLSIPVPIGMMTGASSYVLYVYIRNEANTSNTTSITTGFTVRLVFNKRPQADTTVSVAQS